MPRFVGRLLTGEIGAVMMTELRGASNAKAKRELGWSPAHASWRQGFRGLTEAEPDDARPGAARPGAARPGAARPGAARAKGQEVT